MPERRIVCGVSHSGLWSLVWRNCAVLSVARSQVGADLTWDYAGAPLVWMGTVGSAAKAYQPMENSIQEGRAVSSAFRDYCH